MSTICTFRKNRIFFSTLQHTLAQKLTITHVSEANLTILIVRYSRILPAHFPYKSVFYKISLSRESNPSGYEKWVDLVSLPTLLANP